MKPVLAALCVATMFFSCYRPSYSNRAEDHVQGYKAVYDADPGAKEVRYTQPVKMINPGKIYAIGKMILQNDIGKGVHLYNAVDPGKLKDRGFIQIPGNLELSIKGNYLYANSFYDLVVIDIGNWVTLKEVKRIPNAFSQNQGPDFSGKAFIVRPEKNTYYECIDASKGVQVGWDKGKISGCNYYYN